MQINTHLSFDGHCEEAFKFYEKVLGGKIEVISTYGTSPMAKDMPGLENKVIHGRVNIAGTTVMGADAPPGRYTKPQGASLTLSTENSADAERYFKALSEKGAVSMPIMETFFAHRFGMVTDQFGIPWMVIHQKTMP
jgi:PhnB protein